jgi:hypothetical protein
LPSVFLLPPQAGDQPRVTVATPFYRWQTLAIDGGGHAIAISHFSVAALATRAVPADKRVVLMGGVMNPPLVIIILIVVDLSPRFSSKNG